MSDGLRIAYEYYQNVLCIISHHNTKELDRLLEENIHDLLVELHNAHKILKKHYNESRS